MNVDPENPLMETLATASTIEGAGGGFHDSLRASDTILVSGDGATFAAD